MKWFSHSSRAKLRIFPIDIPHTNTHSLLPGLQKILSTVSALTVAPVAKRSNKAGWEHFHDSQHLQIAAGPCSFFFHL